MAKTAAAADDGGGGASVASKALRGGSYLFLQKIFTFALNSLVLRRLQLSITGAVTVRLELALASIFFLRDGFRLAFLRMPSLDLADHQKSTSDANRSSNSGSSTTSSKVGLVQQLVNVAWLSTAISWLVALAIIIATHTGSSSDAKDSATTEKNDDGLQDYALVLTMYCIAAMVEALAEPMYVLAHCSVLVSWQVAAQGAGFVARALVQYACIFALNLELLAYGAAELAYAATLVLVFVALFWRRIHAQSAQSEGFALTSMWQLLPRAPVAPHSTTSSSTIAIASTGRWFHAELLALLVPLGLQSGVKYLLSEGDKWVLSVFATFEHMGVYGIVFHLGSLVPRIVFLPIEEATKTVFSKMAHASTSSTSTSISTSTSTSTNNTMASRRDGLDLVLVLLKLMHLLALVFMCFGATHAHTLVLVLYGADKARRGVGHALALYCVYIGFLGLNGVCEAVVHALGDARELMRLNKLLMGFFVLYAASAAMFMGALELGTAGIILANCVNMGCRISYCLTYMATRFAADANEPVSVLAFWRQTLPHRAVVAAFAIALGVTATSSRVLLTGAGAESWSRHAAHVAVGVTCFAAVVLVLYAKERHLLREQLAVLRQRREQPSTAKPHEE